MKKFRILWLLIVTCMLMGCQSNLKYGVSSIEHGQYDKAIEYFQTDVDKGRNLGEAYRGIGIARYEKEEYDLAIEACDAALANEAKPTATLYNLMANSYYKVEKLEDALKYYDFVLEMEDCDPELTQSVKYNEIAICQQLGDWNAVKEKVADYVEAYPDDTRMDKTVDFLKTR